MGAYTRTTGADLLGIYGLERTRRSPRADFEMATRIRPQSYRGRKDSALAPYYLWRTGEVMTPFARPLLAWAVAWYRVHPRVIRLDLGYSGLRLIAWIHTALGAVAVIPWNPKRQRNRTCLPPTWTAVELGKRTSIERFFGRVLAPVQLLPPATPAAVWVVGRGTAGGFDLYRHDCGGRGLPSGRAA